MKLLPTRTIRNVSLKHLLAGTLGLVIVATAGVLPLAAWSNNANDAQNDAATESVSATPKKKPVATPHAKKPVQPKLSKEATAKAIEASIASAAKVDPIELLQKPGSHLKQKVTFSGTFNRFADTGLDYKKAFRDSRDYVTFFILRPDVGEKTIPLSEMKLFFPRKRSDEVMDIEPGDKIQIVGTPFSTALDEPWIDVEHIKITQKTAKPERKHTPEF